MDLDMKLKFNFNKRNKYKNICSIEGCNNSACGKYCNKHYHQINTEAIVFENGGFIGNLGLVKKTMEEIY